MSKQKKYSQHAISTNSNSAHNRRYGDGPVGRYYTKHYVTGSEICPEFNYVKYFRQDVREKPPLLRELIAAKLDPAPGYQTASGSLALRSDFVMPVCAPRDIHSVDELIGHFDRIPPLRRDVMIEMKFMLHHEVSAYYAFESIRAFALQYLAGERQLAAILIQHLPARSGSHAARHIHLFAPARQLTADGFGAYAGKLMQNVGEQEVSEAWIDHLNLLNAKA